MQKNTGTSYRHGYMVSATSVLCYRSLLHCVPSTFETSCRCSLIVWIISDPFSRRSEDVLVEHNFWDLVYEDEVCELAGHGGAYFDTRDTSSCVLSRSIVHEDTAAIKKTRFCTWNILLWITLAYPCCSSILCAIRIISMPLREFGLHRNSYIYIYIFRFSKDETSEGLIGVFFFENFNLKIRFIWEQDFFFIF